MQLTLNLETVCCSECGTAVIWERLTRHQRYKYRKTGRAYCSEKCMKEYCRRNSSATMSRTNRKYASARMRVQNPMNDLEIRAKMSATLHRIGHKPKVQGGNGRGMTIPQALLMEALASLSPESEFVVRTYAKKVNAEHYPSHYKVDIAIPIEMLAIEVDGMSHTSLVKKSQDAKKENFLKSRGWTVLRFSNAEILADVIACVRMVTSTISK